MADEFTCPLKAQAVEEEAPPQTPCDDEMYLFGQTFKGVRTYSVVLIILLMYFYVLTTNKETVGIEQLAFSAVSFMFGMKVSSALRK